MTRFDREVSQKPGTGTFTFAGCYPVNVDGPVPVNGF